MHIHEYQAKRLLSAYGVPTPEGRLAATPGEAEQAARDLPGPVWVVKAQIHAGGRGKVGGVKVCRSPEEAREAAASLLGARLVTPQTGPDGERVNVVWIERGTAGARECYLAVALDRASQCLTVMASPDGGMDIEAVAASSPERVFTARLDGGHYLWPFQARNLLEGWGLESVPARELASLVRRLAALAAEKDMTLLEINPLALREEGDPLERAAAEKGLTYVRLGGSIGTLVNGAGLAMATMDAIKQAGAEPANFLDAGGGASEETVAAGFSIMLSDPHVRGILINIFGGILRCDIVAHGIVNAARKLDIAVPLVVRLEGTNVAEGRRILQESGLRFHTASSMSEAARLIVGLAAESPQEAGV